MIVPHLDVLQGTFKQSEFAADLTQVGHGTATPEYSEAQKLLGLCMPNHTIANYEDVLKSCVSLILRSYTRGLCSSQTKKICEKSMTKELALTYILIRLEPVSLLKRIIKMACPPKGLSADFFAGCASTISAAHELNYKWLGCDVSKDAIAVIRKRMVKEHKLRVDVIRVGTLSRKEIYKLSPFEFEKKMVSLLQKALLKLLMKRLIAYLMKKGCQLILFLATTSYEMRHRPKTLKPKYF